jgi:hypothetical protein
MEAVVDSSGLLLNVAGSAFWTRVRFAARMHGRPRVYLPGVVGILALVFSTTSANDDWIQSKLIRPAVQSVRTVGSIASLLRRPLNTMSITALVEGAQDRLLTRARRSLIVQRRSPLSVYFSTPVLIHAPPPFC